MSRKEQAVELQEFAARARPVVMVVGVGLLTLGVLLAMQSPAMPGQRYWPWLAASGGVLAGSVITRWWIRQGGSAGPLRRWQAEGARNEGLATARQVRRVAGEAAMRKKLSTIRPDLAVGSWMDRLRTPTREVATRIARVGGFDLGPLRVGGAWLWSPLEDVTLRLGGPRKGKSGDLGARILDAPGAVVATSTRTDLYDKTAKLRGQKGPVYTFAPTKVGGLESTIQFDPLVGCDHGQTATDRARDLVEGSDGPTTEGDRQFWTDRGSRVLGALMHAAALGGFTMHDVQAWVANPKESTSTVIRALRRSEEPAFRVEAAQFFETNDRTQSSICTTIMPALAWLTDPNAVAAATGGGFDVEQLLKEKGTVYLVAGKRDRHVVPLITALTAHLAREARRLANGRRLEDQFSFVLDEAALICPVPLDDWTADFGGFNIQLHIGCQSRAQLQQRWGKEGASAILNNAGLLILYGGTRDPEDLEAYSKLVGQREHVEYSYGRDGKVTSRSHRWVPALSEQHIHRLDVGQVILLRTGMPAAIGQAQMFWERRDVRIAQASERWQNSWFRKLLLRWEARRTEARLVRSEAQVIEAYDAGEASPSDLPTRHPDRQPPKAGMTHVAEDTDADHD